MDTEGGRRVGDRGCVVRESEENGREKVECDQSLPPQPAVVSMRLNVRPSLWVVVKVTQLYGNKVGENFDSILHLLDVWFNVVR